MEIWDVLSCYLIKLSKLLKLESVDYKDKLIEDIDPNTLLITCLRASDGKEDHTVTIYKNWIFDGNFSHALPLNQESLDICCSSDEKTCLYEFMLHTYMLPLFDQYIALFGKSIKMEKKHANKKQRKVMKRHSKK